MSDIEHLKRMALDLSKERRTDVRIVASALLSAIAKSEAAYERGLRRGMAIARRHEWERAKTVDWTAAEVQMEREIEEAKR